jgi:cytosine/adenosine deaminase-related metal-dependent hydrolase
MRELRCAHVLLGPTSTVATGGVLHLDGERIRSVETLRTGNLDPVLALPALVNAHDHARPVRASSFGAAGKPLEIWLHWLALMPAVDAYLATAVSLARSALGGAGIVMVHYTRTQGLVDFPTEVAAVARAARDIGIRVGFAVALRDRNPLVYGPSEPVLAALPPDARAEVTRRLVRTPLPVAEQIAMVDTVAAATDSPMFNVQYGPHGVQWCTAELLEATAEASNRTGRRVHMHLLETRYQRAWADENHPQGIVRYLDEIGLLGPRLTLAHCTWARPAELELIAERGATIAVSTSSNLGIRSGIAPLAQMVRYGCKVALGLDGQALDEDDDLLREVRLTHLLHGGSGFTVDVAPADVLAMATRNGRRSVLNVEDGGALSPGELADLLLLDWRKLDEDRLLADLDPLDLLFARTTQRHVRELIVAGRTVVRDGKLTGIDMDPLREDLMARLRAGIAGNAMFAAALHDLERVVADNLAGATPCW